MKVDVFAYGLLMYADVLFALTGKTFSLEAATLKHYKRMSFVKEGWPKLAVVLPQQGASVSGTVIRNVDSKTLHLLDLFEGVEDDFYCRSRVTATLESGLAVDAHIYLGTETTGSMTRGVWDEVEFLRNHRRHYMDVVIPGFLNEIKC